MMVDCCSYGDQLECDVYYEHSRFSRAVNFTSSKNALVSFVTQNTGPGPKNIVVPGNSVNHIPNIPLTLEADGFRFRDSEKFLYKNCTHGKYHSHFTAHISESSESSEFIDSIDSTANGDTIGAADTAHLTHRAQSPEAIKNNGLETDFFNNLTILQKHLVASKPQKNLICLLSEKHRHMFQTGFEKAFCRNAEEAVGEIFPGPDYLRGIRKMKGTGFGLTPGGDDFIAGLLIALNVLDWLYPQHHRAYNRIKETLAAAKGKNLFSNTLLTLAAQGHLFEKFNHLIAALFTFPAHPGHAQPDRRATEKIEAAADALLTIGETSGADMCCGFLMARHGPELLGPAAE